MTTSRVGRTPSVASGDSITQPIIKACATIETASAFRLKHLARVFTAGSLSTMHCDRFPSGLINTPPLPASQH